MNGKQKQKALFQNLFYIMGQSCGCQNKLFESAQIVTPSNIEPYPQSRIQNDKENNNDEIYHLDSKSSQFTEFDPKPMQFFTLQISKELYIYYQFLCDSLNTANQALRKKIFDICWDIQYYIRTATNNFQYNKMDWQNFIKSDERNLILNFFNLQNEHKNKDYNGKQIVSKCRFGQSDFEEWLKKYKIEFQRQSIYSKCLEQL
ncbi:unnamed protein product [Paramecium sonneborni]|uniref:Uncharacterized protein n=1 Tax=Paramecium sonneborni TaxID=65129 RepID=A0A8S1PP06_9CILI|nr:unnamed protein product [Paramecium sonneborni]